MMLKTFRLLFALPLLLFFMVGAIQAQDQRGAVAGTVIEADSEEPLPSVNVGLADTQFGAATDEEGRFKMSKVPAGTYTIEASLVGYETVERDITVRSGETTTLNVALARQSVELSGITITGRRDSYVSDEVNATKTGAPLTETLQSIDVISEEQLADQGSASMEEALRYTAGVVTRTFGRDRRFNQFDVRGFSGTQNATYHNGLQVANGTFTVPRLDPYGQQRIEVLRGPSSTLFGAGSPGGVVNLVSKRAPRTFMTEVGVEYGSHNWKQGRLDVGGPIGDDTGVYGRLTGLVRDASTIIEETQNDKLFLAPTVRVEITDDTRLTALASYQSEKQYSFGTLPIQGTLRDNPNGQVNRSFFIGDPNFDTFETDRWNVGYEFEHRFNDIVTLKQKTRYAEVTNEQAVLFGSGFANNQRTLSRSSFTVDDELSAFTVDNQAHVNLDVAVTEHSVLAGVNYKWRATDNLRGFGSAPSIDVFSPSYGVEVKDPPTYIDNEITQQQVGFYLQDQVRVYDDLLVNLGLRHDRVDEETDNNIDSTSTDFDNQKTTYRAGVGYTFPYSITPYVSYSTSFQPLLGSNSNGDPFEPETAQQAELGIRYAPQAGQVLLTGSLYQLTEQNVKSQDPNNPNLTVQGGEIRSRGVELSAKGRLTEALEVTTSYTYTEAEVTEATESTPEGNTPTVAPNHTVKTWTNYTVQEGLLSGLIVGGGLRYVGESWGDGANTIRNPDYTLVDARIGYQWQGLTFNLRSRNALDNEYVVCNGGATACTFGKARRIRADVSYRW